MKSEKNLGKSTLYRCTGCGISDTKLNCWLYFVHQTIVTLTNPFLFLDVEIH
jgi:uncharacterized protein YydD (DUF2326 family)